MLLIVSPVSLISRPISMSVGALSICLVIFPLSFVDVTVCVEQLSKPIRLVIKPVALVARAIRPLLTTVTFTQLVSPFTLINRTAGETDRALRNLCTLESRIALVVRVVLIVIRVLIFKVIVDMFLSTSNVTCTIWSIAKRCIIDIMVLLIGSKSFLHIFFVYLLDHLILRIFSHARTENTSTVAHFFFN